MIVNASRGTKGRSKGHARALRDNHPIYCGDSCFHIFIYKSEARESKRNHLALRNVADTINHNDHHEIVFC